MSMAVPLAEQLRPRALSEVIGQQHLLGTNGPLSRASAQGRLPSMILWGPPGVGKTTIARLLAQAAGARMEPLSAVLAGVKDIREVVERAEQARALGEQTVVFVDEVHRFNKTQQDAFLPHVESGLLILIGATTENPGFEVNGALRSRAQVFRLEPLSRTDLQALLERALNAEGLRGLTLEDDARARLIDTADGDGRRLLNLTEMVGLTFNARPVHVTDVELSACLPGVMRQFDKGGDVFYDQISALHKSIRGSDPDATLYWLARMLDGGADPLYVARRLIRMASEDIGLADPRALEMALSAAQAYERLGSPEGELALAQAAVFLAMAAKSNAIYTAWKAAQALVGKSGSLSVPDHLRNVPTGYRYSHDEPGAFSAGQTYLPKALLGQAPLYTPVDRGLESKIAEKLAALRQKNENNR
ncbi:MAG: replication-associated recombination protein A [Burkholderiaceae bacterium]|jgi:putative ATPase